MKVTPQKIIKAVVNFYGLTIRELSGKSRRKEIAFARQVAMYLLREYAGRSYPVIGRFFKRDHTTAIHAHRKIYYSVQQSNDLTVQIREILDSIDRTAISERKEPVTTVVVTPSKPTPPVFKRAKERPKISRSISPENLEKERLILSEYRSGKTLEGVGKNFDLTRERIRQIVLRAVFREIEEKEKEGFEIDAEEFLRQERLKRSQKQTQNKLPAWDANQVSEKVTTRWSRYYPRCRACGTTTIPHLRKGYCERCGGGFRTERRNRIIAERGNKCEKCGINRGEARSKFERDFYIMRDKETLAVLCRKCFLEETGRRMGHRIRRKNN